MRKFFGFILIMLISCEAFAQRWTMSAGTGATLYKGDLSDWHLAPHLSQMKTLNAAVNFQLRYQPDQAMAYRAKLTFTGLDGNGANYSIPSISFSTNSFSSPLIEFSGLVDYNFKDYQANRHVRNWTPFIYGGLGFLFVSPEGNISSPKTFFTWAIPYGVGVKAQLNNRIGLQCEFGSSKSLSNILDGQAAWGEVPQIFTWNKSDQYLHSSISKTYSLISVYCPRD